MLAFIHDVGISSMVISGTTPQIYSFGLVSAFASVLVYRIIGKMRAVSVDFEIGKVVFFFRLDLARTMASLLQEACPNHLRDIHFSTWVNSISDLFLDKQLAQTLMLIMIVSLYFQSVKHPNTARLHPSTVATSNKTTLPCSFLGDISLYDWDCWRVHFSVVKIKE